jgi:cyanophycinase
MLLEKGANSVTSIVVKSAQAAKDDDLLQRVRRAEAIFFAGGDQSNYARHLSSNPLIKEVNAAAKRGIPVGGTSAGLAILGEFYFPAYKDTITSSDALINPHHERLILEKRLLDLPFLKNVITDSHFENRNRMGRLITFMARIISDNWSQKIRAIGVDESTAVMIDRNGTARIFSKNGHAYLLEPTGTPTRRSKSAPLTFGKINVRRLPNGGTFDVSTWSNENIPHYTLDVLDGKIISNIGTVY